MSGLMSGTMSRLWSGTMSFLDILSNTQNKNDTTKH
jgi:hypothetical protein